MRPQPDILFADGFDTPPRVAFGLGASQLLAGAGMALVAYGVLTTPAPGALRWTIAVPTAALGVALAWGRLGGRPLVAWVVLAARFTLSQRSGGGGHSANGRVGIAGEMVAAGSHPERHLSAGIESERGAPRRPAATNPPPTRRVPLPGGGVESRRTPLVLLPHPASHRSDRRETEAEAAVLALADAPSTSRAAVAATTEATAPAVVPVFVGAARRIAFFSVSGGTGRTTLATEVAALLAARGRWRAQPSAPPQPLRVTLLDLDLRCPAVAARLGAARPTLAEFLSEGRADPARLADYTVWHGTGLRVLLGAPGLSATALPAVRLRDIVRRLERDGDQFLVFDVAAGAGPVNSWVLGAVHDIYVVIRPTAGGIHDAYRSAEMVRRLGHGHKLAYVVNRARGAPALDEVMADLRGRVAATIPEDPAVEEAENAHGLTALRSSGAAAAALAAFAARIYPSLDASGGAVSAAPPATW